MRIIQLTPSLSYGDAVSNDVIAISDMLTEQGYINLIVVIGYTEKVKHRVKMQSEIRIMPDDIVIYHLSIGSELADFYMNSVCYKHIIIYHNITPSKYFKGNMTMEYACTLGRIQLKKLVTVTDFCIADSDYNKEELLMLGYKNVTTIPIFFNVNEYTDTTPSQDILRKYSSTDYVNIIFVGRIAPNKKQEDIISAFYFYNKYINLKSRLFLVGSMNDDEYSIKLKTFVFTNKIKNVIFSGHVSFSDIIAYYKCADVFLCESEHEGFCVPLLEAMIFGIPIIAYNSTAIPYTLGDSGIIFSDKNPAIAAELINLCASDFDLRQKIIKKQFERLDYFSIDKAKQRFIHLFSDLLKED